MEAGWPSGSVLRIAVRASTPTHTPAVSLCPGLVPVTVIAAGTLAILTAAVLVGAIVLAIGPALVSARSRPATLLRTE